MPPCFGCHQEQKDRFYGNPYQHGPTATGFCTICHNPHGTDNEFFVKKATWNLCTTCHYEKGSGRHVVSWGPSGQTHPTRQRPDPSRAGKELSCASCHNPHAAPGAKLWNFGAVRWMDLCRNCHAGIFGG
jgi:predicted CXXCH cytochrome family protein